MNSPVLVPLAIVFVICIVLFVVGLAFQRRERDKAKRLKQQRLAIVQRVVQEEAKMVKALANQQRDYLQPGTPTMLAQAQRPFSPRDVN